ncbi:hypothetical protein IJJ54_01570 [Candidatus Saccharibacteria bacterium]|nr:hypothetical protein [Candidatus Saccharibacteria bacterium]
MGKLKKNKKDSPVKAFILPAFVFAVLFMAVGFAAYTKTLSVTGTTTTTAPKPLYFDSSSFDDESNGGTISNMSYTGTELYFKCVLPSVGKTCSFYIEVANIDSTDYQLSTLTMNNVSSTYYDFSVTLYDEADDVVFTSSGATGSGCWLYGYGYDGYLVTVRYKSGSGSKTLYPKLTLGYS